MALLIGFGVLGFSLTRTLVPSRPLLPLIKGAIFLIVCAVYGTHIEKWLVQRGERTRLLWAAVIRWSVVAGVTSQLISVSISIIDCVSFSHYFSFLVVCVRTVSEHALPIIIICHTLYTNLLTANERREAGRRATSLHSVHSYANSGPASCLWWCLSSWCQLNWCVCVCVC